MGAGAIRVVEGEKTRSQFLKTQFTVGASVFCGVHDVIAVIVRNNKSVCQFYCVFNGFADSSLNAVFYDKSVNDDADFVLDVFVKDDFLVKGITDAVNSHTDVAGTFQLLKLLFVFTLSASNHRCNDEGFHPCVRHDFVCDLVNGLTLDFSATLRTMRLADTGKKQAEIVVDFRHCAHR